MSLCRFALPPIPTPPIPIPIPNIAALLPLLAILDLLKNLSITPYCPLD